MRNFPMRTNQPCEDMQEYQADNDLPDTLAYVGGMEVVQVHLGPHHVQGDACVGRKAVIAVVVVEELGMLLVLQ